MDVYVHVHVYAYAYGFWKAVRLTYATRLSTNSLVVIKGLWGKSLRFRF